MFIMKCCVRKIIKNNPESAIDTFLKIVEFFNTVKCVTKLIYRNVYSKDSFYLY